MVLAVKDQVSPEARAALAELCKTYWYPLYAYVRRSGYSEEDAQDLTQEFFTRFLARGYFARAERKRGRFRTFLLSSMKNFLTEEWHKRTREKRGGGRQIVSFDEQDAEGRYLAEPVENVTPEIIYEKRWASTLLNRVTANLREEFKVRRKGEMFELLSQFLWDREADSIPYEEVAHKLKRSVGSVKVAVHRIRQRYRELLRAEIADTVARSDEIDGELRHLISVISG